MTGSKTSAVVLRQAMTVSTQRDPRATLWRRAGRRNDERYHVWPGLAGHLVTYRSNHVKARHADGTKRRPRRVHLVSEDDRCARDSAPPSRVEARSRDSRLP